MFPINLNRLDQRVADGFDHVAKKLEAMDRRADIIENRLSTLEQTLADRPLYIRQHSDLITRVDDMEKWRVTSEAQLAGGIKVGNCVKATLAAVLIVLAYVGYRVELTPAQPSLTPISTVTSK